MTEQQEAIPQEILRVLKSKRCSASVCPFPAQANQKQFDRDTSRIARGVHGANVRKLVMKRAEFLYEVGVSPKVAFADLRSYEAALIERAEWLRRAMGAENGSRSKVQATRGERR